MLVCGWMRAPCWIHPKNLIRCSWSHCGHFVKLKLKSIANFFWVILLTNKQAVSVGFVVLATFSWNVPTIGNKPWITLVFFTYYSSKTRTSSTLRKLYLCSWPYLWDVDGQKNVIMIKYICFSNISNNKVGKGHFLHSNAFSGIFLFNLRVHISVSPPSIRWLRLGCFCGLGVVYSNKSCTMPPITFQDLPLNIYMVIFGTGIFVFILSLIFCCYFIR